MFEFDGILLKPCLLQPCVHVARKLTSTVTFRANYYTPEITKVKCHRKMPLKVHWTIPVNIHWKSDNPLEHTAEM